MQVQAASTVSQVAGMYLSRGLKQMYSRPGEYLSFSQLLRRLKANARDDDAYWNVYSKIREYASSDRRKILMENQAFQVMPSRLPYEVLEIHCFDIRADHAIHGLVKPYIIVRVNATHEMLVCVKDVVQK